jgi:hypothetical protein|tara:strand:- start:258 stop:470 length:213 start_codon:yes stop_codon:yes gene_type:complete
MMTKKDIAEYNKLIKELEKQSKEKLYGQKENEELEESYKESVKQTKERQGKGPLDSFSKDLKNSIKKKGT